MVYITSWDEFVERSVQLFRADPESTRYVMKYRHCEGKLVLKVTDNKEIFVRREDPRQILVVRIPGILQTYPFIVHRACLKFKTDQAQDAKKMEKLNNIFFTLMSRGPEADPSEVTGKDQMDAQPTKKGRGRKQ